MKEHGNRRLRRAVHIVDDDASMRRAIWFMLESAGYAPRVFASGEDLLEELEYLPQAPMLADLYMPGLDGLDLLAQVRHRSPQIPVIVITAHGDVPSAVQAMKAGAVDFIQKPFGQNQLLAAVDAAAAAMAQTAEKDEAQADAIRRVESLSRRERDVLTSLAAGKSNKLIAYDLDLSIRTVEMHRVRMMRRLDVRTLPQALRLAHLAGLADGADTDGGDMPKRRVN